MTSNSDFIHKILGASDKSAIQRACTDATLTIPELADLIARMESSGFTYTPLQFQWVAPQADVKPNDITALVTKSDGAKNTIRKLIAAFQPAHRHFYIGHLFENGNVFYLFWFTQKSLAGLEGGKFWGDKSHIHLISSHFGKEWTAEKIKKIFKDKVRDALKGEHIALK